MVPLMSDMSDIFRGGPCVSMWKTRSEEEGSTRRHSFLHWDQWSLNIRPLLLFFFFASCFSFSFSILHFPLSTAPLLQGNCVNFINVCHCSVRVSFRPDQTNKCSVTFTRNRVTRTLPSCLLLVSSWKQIVLCKRYCCLSLYLPSLLKCGWP